MGSAPILNLSCNLYGLCASRYRGRGSGGFPRIQKLQTTIAPLLVHIRDVFGNEFVKLSQEIFQLFRHIFNSDQLIFTAESQLLFIRSVLPMTQFSHLTRPAFRFVDFSFD